jgi:cell division protein FtsN
MASPKPLSSAKHAKSPSHAATQKQSKPQLDARSSTQVSASTTAAQTEALNFAMGPASAQTDPGANIVQPGAASQPSAGEPSAAAMQPKTDSADGKMPNLYLEVGKFKDETPASKAADKLNQLGFHAVLLHKNLLWMQSYHVDVGPYTSQKDLAEAQQRLATQGFKPHPVN